MAGRCDALTVRANKLISRKVCFLIKFKEEVKKKMFIAIKPKADDVFLVIQ